jgi:hypothetical protein
MVMTIGGQVHKIDDPIEVILLTDSNRLGKKGDKIIVPRSSVMGMVRIGLAKEVKSKEVKDTPKVVSTREKKANKQVVSKKKK